MYSDSHVLDLVTAKSSFATRQRSSYLTALNVRIIVWFVTIISEARWVIYLTHIAPWSYLVSLHGLWFQKNVKSHCVPPPFWLHRGSRNIYRGLARAAEAELNERTMF